MIPILYESNTTDFNNFGIGALADTISCKPHEEVPGIYECEFTYPITGKLYAEITPDRIIKTKANEYQDPQLFRIYRTTKPINGIVKFYCQHISYDLSVNPVEPFESTGVNAVTALSNILSHCTHSHSFTSTSTLSISDTHDVIVEVPTSARQLLLGEENSVLSMYGGEYEFDNFSIKLHAQRGQDAGVTIRYGKNLTNIEAEASISETYSAIYPYAIDEDDEVYTLTEKTISTGSTASFGENRTLAVNLTDMFDLDEEDIDESGLRTKAQQFIADNNPGTIKQNITISFVQLWQTEEYKDIAPLERVGLCDTVTVIYPALNVSVKAKVIAYTYDSLLERYESMTLGDAKSTLTDAIVKSSNEISKMKKEIVNKSAMQYAIDNATKLITGQSGGYIIFRNSTKIFNAQGQVVETKTLPEGQPAEMLIMDTPSPSTATHVWRYNLSGWGYSSTGVNGPFRLAATSNGAIVADFITTGEMSAARITTGQLTDQAGKNYWNLNNGNFRLSQSNAFNSLTHDGDALGIYMSPVAGEDYNELRINASYIKSGTVDASVVNVTNINASNIKAGIIRDQTNATAKNYWNLSTGEFRLTAGTKVYKDDGTVSGIFYKANGELRINADYIKTGTLSANLITAGTLSSTDSRTTFNLSTGVIKVSQSSNSWQTIDGRIEVSPLGLIIYDSLSGYNETGRFGPVRVTQSGVQRLTSLLETEYVRATDITATRISAHSTSELTATTSIRTPELTVTNNSQVKNEYVQKLYAQVEAYINNLCLDGRDLCFVEQTINGERFEVVAYKTGGYTPSVDRPVDLSTTYYATDNTTAPHYKFAVVEQTINGQRYGIACYDVNQTSTASTHIENISYQSLSLGAKRINNDYFSTSHYYMLYTNNHYLVNPTNATSFYYGNHTFTKTAVQIGYELYNIFAYKITS